MKGIIVGAGRGARLRPATNEGPKCLMDGLGGRRVLDWILQALRAGGVDDIVFVGGYRMEMVQALYPELRYYRNDRWRDNNILASLMYAAAELDTEVMVSYSDIIYRDSVVRRLRESPGDLALAVDCDWLPHYEGRVGHSEAEAENVVLDGERVRRIGKHLSGDTAEGEFIGLAFLSAGAARAMRDRYRELEARQPAPFQQAETLDKAYITDMLQELVDKGFDVRSTVVDEPWFELDTPYDLEQARSFLGTLTSQSPRR